MQTFHADQVIPIVAELGSNHFKKQITVEDLKGQRRTKDLIICRVICTAIFLSSEVYTLNEIGSFMNRDHSTIINQRESFRQSKIYADDFNFQLKTLFKNHVSPFFNLSLDKLYETV
jgi:chromosomal replication initiation ATPase DnaA